ncbi:MAG TPA: aminomethyl-transferring glycine dehydrogenase subunit GcvPB [Candidatus Avamphibacillus sp.]|nr:aminomethyl-transferring glycine dehydrogenase subunit GcvPB [Candidatus Avamphibacillus sp.]
MTKVAKQIDTGYQAPRWNEPIIHEIGGPDRRGMIFPHVDSNIKNQQGDIDNLIPDGMRRSAPADLPEMTEPDVLHHYLRLSQQSIGMVGINLFGTCTMKYNPAVNEELINQSEVASTHPLQHPDTLQGTLKILYDMSDMLSELSGMDRFTFQPGGGSDASYTHACVTRNWLASRGELGKRDEIITTIQTHPANPATASVAGFKIITLPLGPDGYPTLESLKAAVSDRTAALMVGNPDDMGIYNPYIKEWIEIVHEAGGLCFYDHANFNGVMGRIRARELGFDACMFMLHKTFGAPKGGLGQGLGAYGCKEELVQFLPKPIVTFDGKRYGLDEEVPNSIGKVREFTGGIHILVKAYSWIRAMGADGIKEAADISVLANNYMEKRIMNMRGVTRSHDHLKVRRMEMTRFSLQQLYEDTGVTAEDVQARMTDFGIDAFWMSHHPELIPHPFTPEAGEMYSKEELDKWMDALEVAVEEAYENPEFVRTAPHNQAVHRIVTEELDQPDKWATTWRAYKRKFPKN